MPPHHSDDYKLTAVKYYLDNETTYKNTCFDEIKEEVRKAFTKIKEDNYKKYFLYAYKKDKLILPSKESTKKKKT